MSISFSSDPEFMLIDKQGNYRSAIGIVPGTKVQMLRLGKDNQHSVFYDNVLAECCPQYGRTKQEVLQNFRDCFQLYAKLVDPFRLVTQSSHTYPLEECQHLDAMQFGCSPEINAYEMEEVEAPYCEEGNTFRTCGGHIHIGWLEGSEYPLKDFMGRFWITKLLDMFVGVSAVLLDNDPTSYERRKLYGGAGNFRPKDYGVEYRPLSNFWLYPDLVDLIHDLCSFTVNFAQTNADHQALCDNNSTIVKDIINKSDKELAMNLLQNVLSQYLGSDLTNRVIESSKVKSRNFYEAWNINL